MSKRVLGPEDAELWRCIVRHVQPFPGKAIPEPVDAVFLPVSPVLPVRQAAKPPALPESRPESSAAKRGQVADRGAEKRVRRGRLEIAAKLDLHGFYQERAREALEIFLYRSAMDGARVVLIVTGKGRHRRGDAEPEPGVLRTRTPQWLAAPALRSVVAGYASAHAKHGGEGAFYVFLRRPSPE